MVPACGYKRQSEVRLVVGGCELQVRTWWVCLATAVTAATISGVPKDAISCPCISSAVSAVSAAPGVFSDRAPRVPATFGRRIHSLQRWSVHMDIALSQLPPRQSGRSATPICSWRRASRPHDRPLAREGGQGIWLQARGAASCPPASRRSWEGLPSLAESCSMQQNRYRVRVILLTPQNQPPQGRQRPVCGPARRPSRLARRPVPGPAGRAK